MSGGKGEGGGERGAVHCEGCSQPGAGSEGPWAGPGLSGVRILAQGSQGCV